MRAITTGQQRLLLNEQRDERVMHRFMTPRVCEIVPPWRLPEYADRALTDGDQGARETP
jgi:hypothetical protein